jgi:hypothetical protein
MGIPKFPSCSHFQALTRVERPVIAYLQTTQKILKYYFVAFRVTRSLVEFKMAISEQFKSLNLK